MTDDKPTENKTDPTMAYVVRDIPYKDMEPGPSKDSPPSKPSNPRWRYVGEGLALGTLFGVLASQLGIGALFPFDPLILPALVGIVLALTRFRIVLRIATGLVLLITLVIGYTPLVNPLIHSLIRSDPLQPCPAIVVLSSQTHKDGALSAHANTRALQGYWLLRHGYSHQLVMSDATIRYGSQIPAVREQMAMLGLDYPLESCGPAGDTHDEALDVARLAKQHGWKRVILVTHPWHMRRAAAVFESAGVSVLCSPCVESEYDLSDLNGPGGRFHAFQNWLHEVVGYQVYKWRGWIH